MNQHSHPDRRPRDVRHLRRDQYRAVVWPAAAWLTVNWLERIPHTVVAAGQHRTQHTRLKASPRPPSTAAFQSRASDNRPTHVCVANRNANSRFTPSKTVLPFASATSTKRPANVAPPPPASAPRHTHRPALSDNARLQFPAPPQRPLPPSGAPAVSTPTPSARRPAQ